MRDRPDRRDMLMDLLQERRDRRAELMDRLHDRRDRRDRCGSVSQADGTMTRMRVRVIAAICASGCGSAFPAAGTTTRTGAGAGACGSALRTEAAGTAISLPEASGTRTEPSSSSFAGDFVVISPAPSFKTEV